MEMEDLQNLSDEKLFSLCRQYGEQARRWRQKFAGLLPEVNRRRLFEKKGFSSIFEFAKKLAGMSEEHVRRILNIERKFSAMPILKTMLVNGEVSVNKLAKVASIATAENQDALANQVKLLSCRALETLARDEKVSKSVHVNTNSPQIFENASSESDELGLDAEIKEELLELRRKGIDINPFMREALERRKQSIIQEKARIIAKADVAKSRYIPVETRNVLIEEFGEKCSIPYCQKPSGTIHHTQRFALARTHDVRYLAPLCLAHHEIAHSIDVKFHEIKT
ncbi:MAG: hypothetical protein AAB588_01735 [Patescibacteria group bacterium]